MKITPQQAEKLLKGNEVFSQLGFSMMLTRLKGLYAKNPSPEVLQECTSEINTFLDKFDGIMAKEFSKLSEL